MFGAALVPLSQSTMMDIYPVEKRGQAMAIWGVGVMVGPILGPTLGGYLTEMYNWRFVFYINLPFGMLATLGLVFFMPRSRRELQHALRLDRLRRAVAGHRRAADDARSRPGPGLVQLHARSSSRRCWAASASTCSSCTCSPRRSRSSRWRCSRTETSSPGVVMMLAVGTILVSSSSLMAPWLQNQANYPVETAGLVMAPRGIGTMVTMLTSGRLATKFDPRAVMAIGILALAWSMWEMTGWTPDVSQLTIVVTIVIQGAGLGLVFLPLQMLAFATLPAQYRTDGTSLFSLFRNIGAAIGVSVTSAVLAHNAQVVHAEIGALVTPFNRALQDGGAVSHAWNPASAHGAAMLDQVVNQQAQIVAYLDDYKMMIFTTLPSLLLLLLMRRPRSSTAAPADAHAAME